MWLPTMRLLFKAKATSFQVCQNASAIPSIRGKNAMILPVVTATAAKCVVVPMQQCGVTRHHTPGRVRLPCQVIQRPPVRDLHGSKSNMPTPLLSHIALSRIMCGYDENVVQFIINGFKIGCYGLKSQTSMVKNLKSADEFPSVVDQKISKELQLGRILGPYDVQNYKFYQENTGEVSHNSSSVNDFIPREIYSVQRCRMAPA